MKVMIIDDELSPLSLFVEFVADSGISCETYYKNPLAALTMLKKYKYDAAFLDINMAIGDGITDGVMLAEEMIKIDKSLNIFLVTAYCENEAAVAMRLKDNLIKICYKPFARTDVCDWFQLLRSQTPNMPQVYIQTFGDFEVYVNDEIVMFESNKSRELLAYLVHCNGNIASRDVVATKLWDCDKKTAAKVYASLKNERYVLKKLLARYNITELVVFKRSALYLNILPNVACDSWELIKRDLPFIYARHYNYMKNYDWNIEGFFKYPLICSK